MTHRLIFAVVILVSIAYVALALSGVQELPKAAMGASGDSANSTATPKDATDLYPFFKGTLSVIDHFNVIGYDSWNGGVMVPTDFVIGTTTYSIKYLARTHDSELHFGIHPSLPPDIVLSIDGTEYDSVDAEESYSAVPLYIWSNVRLNWTDGHSAKVILSSGNLPSNTPASGSVSIAGTSTVGEELTADGSGVVDANGLDTATFSYQWLRVDGDNETVIDNGTTTTYTLASADVGKAIKVRVSFTDDAGHQESLTSAATASVATRSNNPATGAPTISGTAQVGQTLTVDTSAIADTDGLGMAVFTYQWIRSEPSTDTDIADATTTSYTLASADVGKAIKVRVSFTDDAGHQESLTSAATASVATRPNNPATGAPTTSGTAQVGQTLTVDTSAIADTDGLGMAVFTYQWIRSESSTDTDIADATTTSYTLASADVGKAIKVRVSFTDDAGHQESLTSAATASVATRPNNPATGAPTTSGTAQVGQTLTVDTSAIADTDGLGMAVFTYQWIRSESSTDTDIADATTTSYTLASADVGKAIKVRVSFTDDAGHQESLTSTPTPLVVATVTNTPLAPISVEVSTSASKELVVSWEANPNGQLPTGYKVQWKSGSEDYDASSDSARQIVLTGADSLAYVITELINGTEYTIRVIAINGYGAGPASTETTGAPEAPNFVVIFVDDLGYDDVSFNGATQIQTTNLADLAEEGTVFESGYVTAPVCSPSRAGLLTGRYGSRFGVEGNIAYSPFDDSLGLPVEETLISEYLQAAGYRTGIVGKWHLGAASKFGPLRRGFDYFYGMISGGHDYWNIDASQLNNDYLAPLIENKDTASFDGYLTDALTDKAIDFINGSGDQPFFLYLPYNAPHSPYQAPDNLQQEYMQVSNKNSRAYMAMVHSIDLNIGRLVQALEDSGKRDNTVIFFLSDNGGPLAGPADNGNLREGKGTLYEGGIRVPFLASWPARWPQGDTYPGMVISLDISATVLALAKAVVTDSARPIDGVNLDPYLRGEDNTAPHEALFWRKSWPTEARTFVVRSGEMKLIQVADNTPQLYNLAADIGETDNLYGDERETAAKLAALWNEWNTDNLKGSLIFSIGDYKDKRKNWFKQHASMRRVWAESQTDQTIAIPDPISDD